MAKANNIDFLARRAAAEGFSYAAVKAALTKVEAQLRKTAIEEAERGWSGWEPVTIDKMVGVLTSTRYKGGYMYPGSKVSPDTFQAIEYSRPGESLDGDPVGARAWLEACPIDTEVSEFYDSCNNTTKEVYKKTEAGWGLVYFQSCSEVRDAERRCYIYGNEAAVAEALGVAISPTFRAVYDKAAEALYYQ